MPQKKPYSIFTLGFVSIVFSFIPAVFLFGINWRRLGKPEKSILPITLSIILTAALFLETWYEFHIDNVSFHTHIFSIIFLLNIALIQAFSNLQQKEIDHYKENNPGKLAYPLTAISLSFLWVVIYFGFMISISGVSVKSFFELTTIVESTEYRDYAEAIDEENEFTAEERVKSIRPFYEMYKDDEYLGAEVTYNYVFYVLQIDVDSGEEIIDLALEKFPDDEFYSPEFAILKNSLDLWRYPNQYQEYIDAALDVNDADGARKNLPIIEKFHDRFRDIPFLEGETYHNLGVTYLYLDQEQKALETAKAGLEKFPNSILLRQFVDALENP